MNRAPQIGVIGGRNPDPAMKQAAHRVGMEIARRGAVLICGGMGGVMEEACRGAKEAGGSTVGILPGEDPADANPFVDVAVATGMGLARNVIIIHSCSGVVAVDGAFGTLSEIAFALQKGIPVAALESWDVDPSVLLADGPEEAVSLLWRKISVSD